MPRLFSRGAALIVLFGALAIAPAAHAASDVVISQVYGGGGNSGATYTHDFVELFNRGTSPVAIGGWSVQYASATGSSWNVTTLGAFTLQPGQYFLVRQAQGAGGTTALPTPDASGSATMAATAGKVALVNSATALTVACPTGANVVDFVGFGSTANCSETTPTATLSNTTAAIRNTQGCVDTDNNSADFTVLAPTPRNSSSLFNVCDGPPTYGLSVNDVTVSEGHSGTVTATFHVTLSAPAPAGGVTFNIATADNTATVADNDYVPNSALGSIEEGETGPYVFPVLVNGDTVIEATETFFVNISSPVGTGVVLGKSQGIGTIQNDDFPPTELSISQVYGGGGNSGATYTHDFIEIFNRGTTSVSLSGWAVQYASSNGATWQVTPLTGSIAPGSYYLVQQAAGSGGTVGLPTPDATGNIAMSATAGKIALTKTTTALSGACPAGEAIVDFVGFGGANCFEGAGPTSATSNTTAAIRKRGGCFDSNNNAGDFSIGVPTPRNSAAPQRSCEYVPATINQIQGSGLITPYFGQDVTTSGIVTARKSNGFFLQTPDSATDTDPATSEALFVFTSATPAVAVGDMATVSGTATEFFNLTQLESTLAGQVTVTSPGQPLPSPVVLTATMLDPAGPTTQLEHLEGMRVHAASLVSVGPSNNFGEIHTVFPGVGRPMREPGIDITETVPVDPVTGLLDCCIPRWDRNPERLVVDADGLAGAPFINVTSHVTLMNITGPLDFTFGDYKILPEVPPTTSANLSAVPVPAPAPQDFTVAGFNIENFVNSEAQRRKAALAIRTVMQSPDVITHIEIGSLATLQALATQVNEDAVAAGQPNPGYEARLTPFGTGSQHVGFLVKTSRVQIDSVTQLGAEETFVNPTTGGTDLVHDRALLVMRATVDPGTPRRRPVIIMGVHLRSFIDIEIDGRVRAKRTAQAESMARHLQTLQTENPNTPVIALGDYNAYEFNDGYTDPVSIIKGTPTPGDQIVVAGSPDFVTPDLINLTDSLPPDQRYTFIFEGTPQAIDHVLVNSAVHGYVKGYAVARSNSDFPASPASLYAGDVTRPERASDHDMPVAYFRFPSMSPLTVDKPVLWPADHRMVDVTVSYSLADRCGTVTPTLAVSSNEPVNGVGDGDMAPDWEIIDGNRLRLRAERSSTGTGRIYTITATASDSCGLLTEEQITVTVPHDQRR